MAQTISNPSSKKGQQGRSDPNQQVKELLGKYGTLKRKNNHQVYDIFGQNFVIPKTPSDYRGAQNRAAVLRRIIRANVPSALL